MKTQDKNFFQILGQPQLENLVQEVKETIAINVTGINNKPSFGVVDLWNIERVKRTRVVRRQFA